MQLPFSDLPAPHVHRVDRHFVPPHCPRIACASGPSRPFTWQRKGSYVRKVDLRIVQRFRCLTCGSHFSSQSFRVDYRLRKPWLPLAVFQALVAKTTLRQTARSLGCKLDTVLHHLRLVGRHGRHVHRKYLERARACGGGLSGTFQLDELETFERNRRLCPLTVPVLVQRKTWFVVHAEVASMPARGNLRPFDRIKKERYEKEFGRRISKSKEAVTACALALRAALDPEARCSIETDQKKTYPPVFRAVFGRRVAHNWISSTARRDRGNLLFTINNCLAQARDNMSRLVRRNWGHSKLERNLRWHLWAWILYRNYVREITCAARGVSSASAAGIAARRLMPREVLQWRHELPAHS